MSTPQNAEFVEISRDELGNAVMAHLTGRAVSYRHLHYGSGKAVAHKNGACAIKGCGCPGRSSCMGLCGLDMAFREFEARIRAEAWDEGAHAATQDYGIGAAVNPYRSVVQYMPLADLLRDFRDGDERGWQSEFDYLWSEHTERMDLLCTSVQEVGIREPILLGSDGRVWDGHHRLAAARRLGLTSVPVTRIPPEQRT